MVAGLEGRYDLNRNAVTRLMHTDAYLKGNEDLHLNTWVPLPFDADKPFGFRRHLTDFTPKVQVLRINIPDDVVKSWQKSLKDGEELVTLLLHSDTKKPVEDSIRSFETNQLSWRIDNASQRGLMQTLKMDTPMDGMPDPEPSVYAGADPVNWSCFADRLKTKYIVEIVRCKRDPDEPSKYLWQRPEKKLASIEARFFSSTEPPSGKLSQPLGGRHELVQDYNVPPSPGAFPDFPFTRCEVNIKFSGKTKTVKKEETKDKSESLAFRFDGVGQFKGSLFKGSYQDKRGKEEYRESRTSTVTATVGPRTYEALETRFPETVTGFTATLNLEKSDKADGAPHITTTALTVSGGKLRLDKESPLLKTRIPFHRFMQDERLRRRYGYAFLQYRLEGAATRGAMTPQYGQNISYKEGSISKNLLEVEEGVEDSYVVVTFWFY